MRIVIRKYDQRLESPNNPYKYSYSGGVMPLSWNKETVGENYIKYADSFPDYYEDENGYRGEALLVTCKPDDDDDFIDFDFLLNLGYTYGYSLIAWFNEKYYNGDVSEVIFKLEDTGLMEKLIEYTKNTYESRKAKLIKVFGIE